MGKPDQSSSLRRQPGRRQPSSNLPIYTMLVTAVTVALLAVSLGLPETSSKSLDDTFHLEKIPVSKVLRQNLQLAKHSWEHGVLTHALLELQNPELTVFAGPGYGFDLRNPARGSNGELTSLEAFPSGQLPRCGRGSGSSSAGWGRYDDWTKVKGLRYAASKTQTIPIRAPVKSTKKGSSRQWLTESESAADAASLGWAALLLERAGAEDPVNPVGVGRTAYGEAADDMMRWLVEDNPKYYSMPEKHANGVQLDREVGSSVGRKWAISHRADSVQLWADSVFMVPPFLAAYAVARQDESWLWEAVEQIKAYHAVLVDQLETISARNTSDSSQKGLWKHIVSQPTKLDSSECCHDESYWLTGTGWAVAGIVRVLGVLTRWQNHAARMTSDEMQKHGDQRAAAIASLESMSNDALATLKKGHGDLSRLLSNYLDEPGSKAAKWAFEDAAGTALVVSSIYRLAQIDHLQDRSLINWADDLYNVVAKHVDQDGFLGPVTTVSQVPAKESVNATSEGQSFALMMFAARRDCISSSICRSSTHQTWPEWFGLA